MENQITQTNRQEISQVSTSLVFRGRQVANPQSLSPLKTKLIQAEMSKRLALLSQNEKRVIFNKIVIYTGVKFSSVDEAAVSMEMVFSPMMEVHPKCTGNEILMSYFLASKGTIEFEIFREISFPQMNSLYKLYKKFEIKQFETEMKNQTLFLEEETKKDFDIEEEFLKQFKITIDHFNTHGEYPFHLPCVFLYDCLRDRGIIEMTEERKVFFKEKARAFLKNEAANNMLKASSIGERNNIKSLINSLIEDENVKIVNQAKYFVLHDYLKNWQEMELSIEEILNNQTV